MAVDLDVIPRSPTLFKWGELRQLIHRNAFTEEAQILLNEGVVLCDFQSKRSLNEYDVVECPGYYYFQLTRASTLSMAIEPNTGDQEESEYLDDMARNLTLDAKESLLRQWEEAGFLISISSNAGRPKGEVEVLTQIARCIAKLTNGLVVVKENGVFSKSVGIYRTDEFACQ